MSDSKQTVAVLSDSSCRSAVRFDGRGGASSDVCVSYSQLTECCNTLQTGAVDVKSEARRGWEPIKVEFIRVPSEEGGDDTWIACVNGRRTTLESNKLYLPDAFAGIAQAEIGGLEKNGCPSVIYSVRIEEGARSIATASLRVELRHESTESPDDNRDSESLQESVLLPYTASSISASCTVAPYPFCRSNCQVGALVNRLALEGGKDFDSDEFNTGCSVNAKLLFSETAGFLNDLKGQTILDLGVQFTRSLVDGTFSSANAKKKNASNPSVRKPVDTYRNKIKSTSYEYVLLGGGGTDAIRHLREAIEQILTFSDRVLQQKSSLALPDYLTVMVNLLDLQSNKRAVALFLHLITSSAEQKERSWLLGHPVARFVAYPLLGVFLKYQFGEFMDEIVKRWESYLAAGQLFAYVGGPVIIAFASKRFGVLKTAIELGQNVLSSIGNLLGGFALNLLYLILPYLPSGLVLGAVAGGVTAATLGSFAAAIIATYGVVVEKGEDVSIAVMTDAFCAAFGLSGKITPDVKMLLENSICPLIKLIFAGFLVVANKATTKSDESGGYELFMKLDRTERLEQKSGCTTRCVHLIRMQDEDESVREIEVLARDDDAELAACVLAGNFDDHNDCVSLLTRLMSTLQGIVENPSKKDGSSNAFFKLSKKIEKQRTLKCHGVLLGNIRKSVESQRQKKAFLARVEANAIFILNESKESIPNSFKFPTKNFEGSSDDDFDTLWAVESLERIANSEFVNHQEMEKTRNAIRTNSRVVTLAIEKVSTLSRPEAAASAFLESKILKFSESAYVWKEQTSRGQPCVLATRSMPQVPVLQLSLLHTRYTTHAQECELSQVEMRMAELELEEPDVSLKGLLRPIPNFVLRYSIAAVLTHWVKNYYGISVARRMEQLGANDTLTYLIKKTFNGNIKELILVYLGKLALSISGLGGLVGLGNAHNLVYFASLFIGAEKILSNATGKLAVDSAAQALFSPWDMLKSILESREDKRFVYKQSLVYRKCLKARFGNPVLRTRRTFGKLFRCFDEQISATLEKMDRSLLLQETMVMSESGLRAVPRDCELHLRRDVENQLKKYPFCGYPREVFAKIEEVEYHRNIRPLLKIKAVDDFQTNAEYQSAMIAKSNITSALGTRSTLLESRLQRLQRVTDAAVAMLKMILSKNLCVSTSSLVWACQEGGMAALYIGLGHSKFAEYITLDHTGTSKARAAYWTPYKKSLLASYFEYYQETPPDFTLRVLGVHMQHVARVLSTACPGYKLPVIFTYATAVDADASIALISSEMDADFWPNARTDVEVVQSFAPEIADAHDGIALSEIREELEGRRDRFSSMHFYCPARGVEFCSVLLESLEDVAARLSDCVLVSPQSSGCYKISQRMHATGHARHPLVVNVQNSGQGGIVSFCNFTSVSPPRTDDDVDGLCEAVRSICFNCERAFYAIKWAYDCSSLTKILLDVSGKSAHLCTAYALATAWVGLPTAWSGINLAISCRTQEEAVKCKTLLAKVHRLSVSLKKNGIRTANISALAAAIYINAK
jgi:hypothetical protein